MDALPLGNDTVDRLVAEEVVRGFALHPIVDGYDLKVGETWDGDPAVWAYLHAPEWDEYSDADIKAFANMIFGLSTSLGRAIPHRLAFVQMVAKPDDI